MTRPAVSDRIRDGASAARDVLALLFTPVVTIIAAWLICILAYGAWATETQAQRIHYLGAVGLLAVVLVGLGGQWFQRNRLERLKLTGPGGFGGEVETAPDAAVGSAPATTITEAEAP